MKPPLPPAECGRLRTTTHQTVWGGRALLERSRARLERCKADEVVIRGQHAAEILSSSRRTSLVQLYARCVFELQTSAVHVHGGEADQSRGCPLQLRSWQHYPRSRIELRVTRNCLRDHQQHQLRIRRPCSSPTSNHPGIVQRYS